MEKSSKRGKIPQHDWPSIIQRYEAGETLTSIARSYGCSPPAISYIVSRSRAREVAAEGATAESSGPTQSQLVKGPSEQAIAADGSADAPKSEEIAAAVRSPETSTPAEGELIEARQGVRSHPPPDSDASRSALPGADGAPKSGDMHALSETSSPSASASGQPDSAESRRTLRLSLSQEAAHRSDLQRQHSLLGIHSSISGTNTINRSTEAQERALQPNRPKLADYTPPENGGPVPIMTEPQRTKDSDTFIDQALRDRVDSDITTFLAAFDAALAADTPESRAELRRATDRLLRAGARTRIQLERLEARAPLPPRDGHTGTVWRAR